MVDSIIAEPSLKLVWTNNTQFGLIRVSVCYHQKVIDRINSAIKIMNSIIEETNKSKFDLSWNSSLNKIEFDQI